MMMIEKLHLSNEIKCFDSLTKFENIEQFKRIYSLPDWV